MKKSKLLLYIFLACFAFSCAKIGSPTGGLRDSIPPKILKQYPVNKQLNFTDNKVEITFDEFIQLDKIKDQFLVSPPLKEKPVVKNRGKKVVVFINDTLKENTTYTLDFGNSIKDNNEGNPLGKFQVTFSTGNSIDSLRIMGRVINSYTQEPETDAWVMLFDKLEPPFDKLPDHIAKTDTAGYFSVNNVKNKPYKIMALKEEGQNFLYNNFDEAVAFLDTIITPTSEAKSKIDTLKLMSIVENKENKELKDTIYRDSIITVNFTKYYPDNINLFTFKQKDSAQYLSDYKRDNKYFFTFAFKSPRKESLELKILNDQDRQNWYTCEENITKDSLKFWITDSLVYNSDTLKVITQYLKSDTLKRLVPFNDTIKLNFKQKTKRKKKKPVLLGITKNIAQSFDLYKDIELTFDQPVNHINKDAIKLYNITNLNKPNEGNEKNTKADSTKKDTLGIPVKFELKKLKKKFRTYAIVFNKKGGDIYNLKIDSASIKSIYNIGNDKIDDKFTVKKADSYGKILLKVNNVSSNIIVELLSKKQTGKQEEQIVKRKFINKSGDVLFEYLKPQKYFLKIIFDTNNNKKWDTGNLLKKIQPEPIIYYENEISIRENWENEIIWDL